MTVIGLGTQDSLSLARDFRETYGTKSFPLLWDPSFDSWSQLGVYSQPAGFLLTADGTIDSRWQGAIPEGAVLERIAQIS